MARDVAVQMCDTLEGKAYAGVVNVPYMAAANEVTRYMTIILSSLESRRFV